MTNLVSGYLFTIDKLLRFGLKSGTKTVWGTGWWYDQSLLMVETNRKEKQKRVYRLGWRWQKAGYSRMTRIRVKVQGDGR